MSRSRLPVALAALTFGLVAAVTSGPAGAQAPVTEPARAKEGLLPDVEPTPVGVSPASREGATGLDLVLSATPGAANGVRMRWGFVFGTADDFPEPGAENEFSGSVLALAFTPHELVEIYAAMKSTSNQNDAAYPALLQTQGDTTLGVKSGAWVLPNLAVGGALSGHFTSGLGASGAAFDATSFWLRGLATADWARTDQAPIRLLLDVGYYFEKSDEATADAAQPLNKTQEWGLQVARYDRVTVGLGLEAPVNEWVSPFLEYRVDVPLQVELTRRADLKDDFTFGAVPHALTPGVRFFPVPSLSVDAAVRIGLSDKAYLGVPATPPYLVVAGVGYAFEPQGRAAPPPPPPPVSAPAPTGTVRGRVLAGDPPPADIFVEYPGANRTAQVTSRDGRFESYDFAPGKVKVRARAARYLAREVEVEVAAGKATAVEIKLDPDPSQAVGTLVVQVAGPSGSVAGTVLVPADSASGQAEVRAEVRAGEPFKGELKPGTYKVTALSPGLRSRTMEVTVQGGQTANLRIALEKGGASRATIQGKRIGLSAVVKFEDGKATLSPSSEPLLDDVADVMRSNPQVEKVLVAGHTDGRGDEALNKRLSEDRARAVVDYLVSRGVDRNRLATRGYGADKPLAPNATRKGQDKNRRVEFIILEQSR
jgi:outer membrane protein OmpA-like peptidoglycan-associated protein